MLEAPSYLRTSSVSLDNIFERWEGALFYIKKLNVKITKCKK